MTDDFNETARRLRNAVEPVAAGVHFALKANAAHQALRFDGSPITQDGVARSGMKTCFFSRSACMGQVPGEVVASAFGCFNPKAVVPAVAAGWQITNREKILAARERVAIAMLERILGDQPKRLDRATEPLRPIYGGLRSHRSPHAWARLSRAWPATTSSRVRSSPVTHDRQQSRLHPRRRPGDLR